MNIILYAAVCLYRYIRQPPSGLQCNPYSETASLKTECIASIPTTAVSRTEIIWLYNGTQINNGSFLPLERITESINNDIKVTISAITFREGGLNETYRGNYSCQVVVDGNLSFTVPTPPLVLVEEVGYAQEMACIDVQSEVPDDILCASITTTTTAIATDRANKRARNYVLIYFLVGAASGIMILVCLISCLCLRKKIVTSFKGEFSISTIIFLPGIVKVLYSCRKEGGGEPPMMVSSLCFIASKCTPNFCFHRK